MIDDILNTILILIIFIIIYFLYCELKQSIVIDYIIDDAKETYGLNYNKNYIKNIIRSKYGMLRFFYKKHSMYIDCTDDVLYKKSNHDAARYAYCIIGDLCTYSEYFSYDLFEHCEKRLVAKRTEHDYMHTCLNRLIDNIPCDFDKYSFKKCLSFFCQEYVRIDYANWNEMSVNLNSMIYYAEKARDSAINRCPNYMKDDLNIFFDLYISQIKEYWDIFTKF